MNMIGEHGAHHLSAQEHAGVVLLIKQESVEMEKIIAKVEAKNTFLATLKIAQKAMLISGSNNVHILIGLPSRVFTTTGCHIPKLPTPVS